MIARIATAADTLARRARNHLRRRFAAQIVAHRNGEIITTAIQTGELVTTTGHLTTLGVDAEFSRRFGSVVGRKFAAAYRTRTGTEPLRAWTVASNGYPILVAVYLAADPALTEGLAAYDRTKHLVAA